MKSIYLLFTFLLFIACGGNNRPPQIDPDKAPWPDLEAAAKGTTVRMMMWQGDPLINRYMSEWVVPELKKR
ncbi:MAG: hypothetical protein KDC61_18000, partial [Saprospiraceae bacterium]|nr:hypothetical protein [Saprospiraceae bacterium]